MIEENLSVAVKRIGQAAWDMSAWIVATFIVWSLRFDFQPNYSYTFRIFLLALSFAVAQLFLGFIFHLYRGRYRIGSIDEVSGVTLTAVIISGLGTAVVMVLHVNNIPRSLPALAGVFALGIMLSGRVALRLYRLRFRGDNDGARTLIYGAGHTGEHLLRLMVSDPARTFNPVGVLDDDPKKQRLRSYGVRVLGSIDDLERAVAKTAATTLVIAITRVTSDQMRDLDRRCTALNLDLRIIPSGNEMLTEGVSLGDISQITVEDLLGRRPINVDDIGISKFLKGKRILITGAGGSIGSELARQVSRYEPSFLGILDRDESGIQSVQLSIDGHGLLCDDYLILADIRDSERVQQILAQTKPDIVFHAAALKHLSLLEANPDEAVKTNILGTANVIKAALAVGVKTFVNISTDKAADPESVLGLSKRVTERLTSSAGRDSDVRYMSVRFGNVLGSRGSVLHTFREQIAAGGPVTVTDPNVTRYFMTIKEAVHLVLQAATIGENGKTLILDMGEPVRIADVARQLIDSSGRDIEISYVGLRPAEKMHEILIGKQEQPKATAHPLVTQVSVEPLDLKDLDSSMASSSDGYQLMRILNGLAS